MACLLISSSIIALASEEFESPGGKVVEVKSQEELASLAGGLNWSDNNTIYVMVPTLSYDNFTSPINKTANDAQVENQTAGESLKADSLTSPIVALRSNKNNKYVNVRRVEGTMGEVDYSISATSDGIGDCEKFQLIDLGNGHVAIKCCSNELYLHVLRPFGIWTEKVECWPPDEFGNLDSAYKFKKINDDNGG